MRLFISVLLLVAATLAQAADDDMAKGSELFESRCSGVCHQTPEIGQLTPAQWQVVLNTMQLRMKQFGMLPLEDAEYQMLLNYLTAQATQTE
jgi:cytochrome c2